MRISESFCKMRLSEYCTSQDIDRAIAVTVDSFVGSQKVSCKKALARAFAKYVPLIQFASGGGLLTGAVLDTRSRRRIPRGKVDGGGRRGGVGLLLWLLRRVWVSLLIGGSMCGCCKASVMIQPRTGAFHDMDDVLFHVGWIAQKHEPESHAWVHFSCIEMVVNSCDNFIQ